MRLKGNWLPGAITDQLKESMSEKMFRGKATRNLSHYHDDTCQSEGKLIGSLNTGYVFHGVLAVLMIS